MKIVTTVNPFAEPVSLAEMREHLGIYHIDEIQRNPVISRRISAARAWVENYTGKRIMSQTLVGYDSRFPPGAIDLIGPVIGVNSIKYIDSSGTLQTLPPEDYLLDPVEYCIVPAHGKSWPTPRLINGSVRVEYEAGYGHELSEAVPAPIIEAIKFIVGQWEVFQSSIEGVVRPFTIPYAATQLLESYRDMRGNI